MDVSSHHNWLDESRWFAVYTKMHGENRADYHLASQGFKTFTPRFRKTVRHARQTSTVLAPLFPRYLFVSLNLGRDRWRSVNGTFGVSTLIMFNDRPAPVPVGFVEMLMASVDTDSCVDLTSRLHVGSSVRLRTGPFANLICQLQHIDDKGRVRVLLYVMGRFVSVLSTADGLDPAD